jgi:hypothetical protein
MQTNSPGPDTDGHASVRCRMHALRGTRRVSAVSVRRTEHHVGALAVADRDRRGPTSGRDPYERNRRYATIGARVVEDGLTGQRARRTVVRHGDSEVRAAHRAFYGHDAGEVGRATHARYRGGRHWCRRRRGACPGGGRRNRRSRRSRDRRSRNRRRRRPNPGGRLRVRRGRGHSAARRHGGDAHGDRHTNAHSMDGPVPAAHGVEQARHKNPPFSYAARVRTAVSYRNRRRDGARRLPRRRNGTGGAYFAPAIRRDKCTFARDRADCGGLTHKMVPAGLTCQ